MDTGNGGKKVKIELPEITRVEGHAAVHVDIEGTQVRDVQLRVFEGTRFFEKLIVGHHFSETPHITSRVCAICSTGHVLASIFAQESILGYMPGQKLQLLRELMHLGMIIESHATHIFALALPDFVKVKNLVEFASAKPKEFADWTQLRSTGSAIQATLGGRPFHPVNLQVGGFSHYPAADVLLPLLESIEKCRQPALDVCEFLAKVKVGFARTSTPVYLALVPQASGGAGSAGYGYFGTRVRSTAGWEAPISEYKEYLQETAVPYSHAKRTTARGQNMMVGSLARLRLFGVNLAAEAGNVYRSSPIAEGDDNSVWNTLGQAIEVVDALERAAVIIREVAGSQGQGNPGEPIHEIGKGGSATGAVECPRGTLYHSYTIDDAGMVTAADLVTPSVQNTGRIELDIREIVACDPDAENLPANLETCVRAYDPCNTCATHMVEVRRQ